MKTADALMVVYEVVLSSVLVFMLGYFAGWRHANARPGKTSFHPPHCVTVKPCNR